MILPDSLRPWRTMPQRPDSVTINNSADATIFLKHIFIQVFFSYISRRSSVGTFIGRQQTETKEPKERKPPAPKLDIRSMVDVDEMPDLFRSIDRKYLIILCS